MSNVIELSSVDTSKEMLEKFSTAYASNGGDHINAYKEAGFSEKTAGQNAKKYLDKHHEYVMQVVKKSMGQHTALLDSLLMKAATDDSIPWGHRLKAIEMMLKNSGIQKDTLVIEDNKVDDLSPEERAREIQELMEKYANVN